MKYPVQVKAVWMGINCAKGDMLADSEGNEIRPLESCKELNRLNTSHARLVAALDKVKTMLGNMDDLFDDEIEAIKEADAALKEAKGE